MDKKTKLWLGLGVVGVGAYLLFKSKKATSPALAPSAPANLVGFDTGKFYDVKGGHAGVKGEGVFTNADGDFANASAGWNPFRRKKKVGRVEIGEGYATGEKGQVVSFANQPFNFAGDGIVGERKVSFADAMGDRMISANGVGKEFFEPKTQRFSKTPPPRRITPVERPMPATPVTQPTPLNNFASAQGAGMINSFNVKGGF
jgi:hypothetical protein